MRKKRSNGRILLLLLLFLAPAVYADEEYDALDKAYQDARKDWSAQRKQLQATNPDADLSALPPYPSKEFLPRYRAYAEKHAGTPDALPALHWLVREGDAVEPSAKDYPIVWAIEQMTRHHAADPSLADELRVYRFITAAVPRDTLLAFYDRVIKENPDRSAAAWAKYNIACRTYEDAAVNSANSDDANARAIELLRQLVTEYDGTDAAKYAASLMYEIENLQIGMKAPEIAGADADGKEIKLSQYRGNVVVLAFWGHW